MILDFRFWILDWEKRTRPPALMKLRMDEQAFKQRTKKLAFELSNGSKRCPKAEVLT